MVVKRIIALFKKPATHQEILYSRVLLDKHQKIINNIYHHSHAPEKHFEKLYLSAIECFAVWVQNLPASQSHHHSDQGGFLLHTLEVVEIAMKNRNTKMLPVGSSAEKQNAKKDVWTFAVFVAALLHDVGKTVSDIHVMLYDKSNNELGRWSPWTGAMSNIDKAKYYQYQYNDDRKYQQHGLLPLALLSRFISPAAIDWMQQESDLFTLLLMTLHGRYAEGGVIADIIKYADSKSCASSLANQNVGAQHSANKPTQPKSLADKLLETMRYLVLETDIKMNQPGAVAYTDNSDIYFVSKVMLDKIRNSLNENKQKGIPFDNSRMMDELLQFHIIIPNKDDKAIWHINISGGGFKKETKLTMLRMSLDKIFIDGNYPPVFPGVIACADDEHTVGNDNKPKPLKPSAPVSAPVTPLETQRENQANNSEQLLPLPPGFDLGTPSDNDNSQDTSPKQATGEVNKVGANKKPEKQLVNDNTNNASLETELGKDFFNWSIKSVNDRKIEINSATAKVHIVIYKGQKSLFLVSPKIFKEYDADNWAQIQKQFGRLKINLKTSTDENIWKVQTKTQRKGKIPAVIRGYLIVNPANQGFNELPEPNKHLDLIMIQPKHNE